MAHLLPPAGVRTIKDEAFMFFSVKAHDFFPRESHSRIPPNIHDYRFTDYKRIERKCKEQDAAAAEAARSIAVQSRPKFNPALRCPSTVQEQWRVPPCACPQYRGVGYRGGRGCSCTKDIGTGRGRDLPPGGAFDERSGVYINANDMERSGHDVRGCTYCSGVAGRCDGLGAHGQSYQSQPSRGVRPGAPITVQQQTASAEVMTGDWGYCPPVGLDPRCLVRPSNKAISSSVRPTGNPYFAQDSRPTCTGAHLPTYRKGDFTFDDWLRTVDQREPPAALRNACIPSLVSWCKPVSLECPTFNYSFTPFQSRPLTLCC